MTRGLTTVNTMQRGDDPMTLLATSAGSTRDPVDGVPVLSPQDAVRAAADLSVLLAEGSARRDAERVLPAEELDLL
jgi:hypothetical protein